MNKQTRRLVGFVVLVVIGYFFVRRLSSSWDELSEIADFSLSIWSVVALLLFVFAVISSGALWSRVITFLKKDSEPFVSQKDGVRVHIGSWLLKYIPGQVGSFVYKVTWGSKHGLSKRTTTLSFVYENLFLTIVSLLPTSVILLFLGDLSATTNAVLVGFLGVSILLVFNRRFLHKFVSFLSKKAKLQGDLPELFDHKQTFAMVGRYALPRIINGLGFVAIAASLYSIGPADVLPLIAAYTLAGIIGIYAIFVPSGLGVREAMVGVFAAGVLGVDEALLLGVIARFYATAADGILAAVYSVMTAQERGSKT